MHGYDVTDAQAINPEIGTHETLKALIKKVREKGMYWLQDIVPNHMAFHTSNALLMDVLERGQLSSFYNYFDVDWNHPSPALNGKICVPFLGKHLEDCVESNELRLVFSDAGFGIAYFETVYPLSIQAFRLIQHDFNGVGISFEEISEAAKAEYPVWIQFKKKWIADLQSDEEKIARVRLILDKINRSKPALLEILRGQNYILTFWQEADKVINYRRFFTVNELICLRMEDQSVFDHYHAFIHQLHKENSIDGLRIDHIDGLQNPHQYLCWLRNLFGDSMYIIAEKILEANEYVQEHWPIQGTSGYKFLSHINQLITDRKGARTLIGYYRGLVPELPVYKNLVFENKKRILTDYMGGEWDNLVSYLISLNLQNGFSTERLKQALGLVMIALPVYRIYPEELPLQESDLHIINETFVQALLREPAYESELLYLKSLLTQPCPEERKNAVLKFFKRLMQFTGPLTAKGVEDTTFYVYNPLISHDEVGDTPSQLGISIQEFHGKMQLRLQSTPLSLNATATHDTKRGEDARIRLGILSMMPAKWIEQVNEWFILNEVYHHNTTERKIPSVNDEYFIYQALVGGFPEDLNITDGWTERLKAYLVKAMREAKANSNWTTPDENYEQGVLQFVESILTEDSAFVKQFIPFVSEICQYMATYSLVQVALKTTAPGIPDIYQGCELFDLSFVDPDNRRPIDYERRIQLLNEIETKEREGKDELFSFLAANRHRGAEKLFVTWRILNFRRENNALFVNGDYIPLTLAVDGKQGIAYARHYKNQWLIVVLPLGIVKSQHAVSNVSSVLLPEGCPAYWRDIFSGRRITGKEAFNLDMLLHDFPVSILTNVSEA